MELDICTELGLVYASPDWWGRVGGGGGITPSDILCRVMCGGGTTKTRFWDETFDVSYCCSTRTGQPLFYGIEHRLQQSHLSELSS